MFCYFFYLWRSLPSLRASRGPKPEHYVRTCPEVRQLLHISPSWQQLGYIGAVNMVFEANRKVHGGNANSLLYLHGLAYCTHWTTKGLGERVVSHWILGLLRLSISLATLVVDLCASSVHTTIQGSWKWWMSPWHLTEHMPWPYISLYQYPVIPGIMCSYCQGSKSLHFTNSSVYSNTMTELWKHVVTHHNYDEDAERFYPTTELFDILDSNDWKN